VFEKWIEVTTGLLSGTLVKKSSYLRRYQYAPPPLSCLLSSLTLQSSKTRCKRISRFLWAWKVMKNQPSLDTRLEEKARAYSLGQGKKTFR
jgi:hypothetical protein